MLSVRLTRFLPFPSDTCLAALVYEKEKNPMGVSLAGSPIEKALEIAKKDGFEGKIGQVAIVHGTGRDPSRYLFAGLGPEKEATLESMRRALSALVRQADTYRIKNLALRPALLGGLTPSFQAATEGALLGLYRYTTYKSKEEPASHLQTVHLLIKDASEQREAQKGIDRGLVFADATNFARDLINRPPSDTTPEMMCKAAKSVARPPIKIKVLNKAQIGRLGMGGILGVNRGSGKPPYFIHLTYRPKSPVRRNIALCGKGITFDSGGLSLKPARAMETMKSDMSGAALVIAIFKALAKLKPPVEVQGFAALTENMPGENAMKPGDILKALNGKTIEVLNTDAEGRLILSDTLVYAGRQKPDEIIDVATLTGACVVALGTSIAGLMGTDEKLIHRIKEAAKRAGEKVWEMPLEKSYAPLLKSKIADLKNMGPEREAGTILGGLFLKEFVDPARPWAHIDIASTAFSKDDHPLGPAGGTGVMVRTLLHYILSYQ